MKNYFLRVLYRLLYIVSMVLTGMLVGCILMIPCLVGTMICYLIGVKGTDFYIVLEFLFGPMWIVADYFKEKSEEV